MIQKLGHLRTLYVCALISYGNHVGYNQGAVCGNTMGEMAFIMAASLFSFQIGTSMHPRTSLPNVPCATEMEVVKC